MEFLFQLGAGLGDLGQQLFILGQQVVHIAGAVVGVVRVLEIEVEVAGLDRVDGNAPGLLILLALAVRPFLVGLAPPLALGLELLDADRLALVVALGAGRIGMLVVPNFRCRRALGEEEQVRADAGVRIEDAVGQADDGVQVALVEQGLLDSRLNAFAEERAVGEDQPSAAAGLEDLHQEHEEQIGRLARAELGGEVGLDAVLLHAAEGGIRDDHIHALLRRPVAQRAGQRVVMVDVGRYVNAVQQQIGHAQDVRQVLFLDAGEAALNVAFMGLGLSLLAQMFDGADEEAAGAAGGVEDGLAKPWVDLLHDELRNGPRSVELARVTRGLEVFEQLLVDVAEHVAIIGGIEVDAVDLVDDLPHQGAILHVVVGILECHANQPGDLVGTAGKGFQLGQEGVVHEVEEFLAGDTLVVAGPIGPTEVFWKRRFVSISQGLHLLLAVVEDFQEEHPAELLQALGITVGARVFSHDVLDGFDDV